MPRKQPPLVSLVGSDGTGKSFLLGRIRQLKLPLRAAFLPCTDYHSSPWCRRPALSVALESLGRHADRTADPMLKAHSLLLKMSLFAGELEHLTGRLQPELIFSTRHPVIDTAVYMGMFLEQLRLKGRLKALDLSGLTTVLTTKEMGELEAWMAELRLRHGHSDLAAAVASLHSRPLPYQLQALQALYDVPLPAHCLFLDPAPAVLDRHIMEKGGAAELHEQSALMQGIQSVYRNILGRLDGAGAPFAAVSSWSEPPGEEERLAEKLKDMLTRSGLWRS